VISILMYALSECLAYFFLDAQTPSLEYIAASYALLSFLVRP